MARSFAVLIALLLAPAGALAQSVGSAFSGPTTADGASAYWNPAAMAEGEGTMLEIDLGLSLLGASYAPDTIEGTSETNAVKPIATLGGFTDVLGEQFRLGLTVTVPQTTGGSWDRNDGAADITRFYITDAAIFHVTATPAFSWSPTPWLTLGVGATVANGQFIVELDKDLGASINQTVGSDVVDSPLPYGSPELAAQTNLRAQGWGVGAVGGVIVRPVPELSIGASIHSPVSITGSGTVDAVYPDSVNTIVNDVVPGAELPDLSGDIEVDLTLPMNIYAAVAYRPSQRLEVAAEYRYINRASQPSLLVDITKATSNLVEDAVLARAYRDQHTVSLRGEYSVVDELRVALFGRYTNNTVPENTTSPSTLDFTKWELGLAVRWQISQTVGITAQYSHFIIPDTVVRNSLHRPLAQPSLATFNHPRPTGTYSVNADTFQLGATFSFR
ncbi:MAG: outer membrane protein transport protein [Myxococcota bacterium]